MKDKEMSRSVILTMIASGKMNEKDFKLTEEEKKIVESQRKTFEIIKRKNLKVVFDRPID